VVVNWEELDKTQRKFFRISDLAANRWYTIEFVSDWREPRGNYGFVEADINVDGQEYTWSLTKGQAKALIGWGSSEGLNLKSTVLGLKIRMKVTWFSRFEVKYEFKLVQEPKYSVREETVV
jgi:hypothetical protein